MNVFWQSVFDFILFEYFYQTLNVFVVGGFDLLFGWMVALLDSYRLANWK
jgi:hypothetical protein